MTSTMNEIINITRKKGKKNTRRERQSIDDHKTTTEYFEVQR